MSSFDDDLVSNVSNNQTFEQVLQARVSRRSVLGGGVTAAAAVSASLGGVGALLNAVPAEARGGRSKPRLGFEGVPAAAWTARVAGGQFDEVIVPTGYTAEVLIAWGDPVSNGPAFKQDASNTSDDQAQQWGMHNDGIVYFPINGSSKHGFIVQNHEYTDDGCCSPTAPPTGVPRRPPSRRTPTASASSRSSAARRMGSRAARPASRGVSRANADRDRRAGGWARAPEDERRPRRHARCSARSTTARWATRRGARISPARRTSTATSQARDADSSRPLRHHRGLQRHQWHTTDTRFDADCEPNEANGLAGS